jgi:hypothetical protein
MVLRQAQRWREKGRIPGSCSIKEIPEGGLDPDINVDVGVRVDFVAFDRQEGRPWENKTELGYLTLSRLRGGKLRLRIYR